MNDRYLQPNEPPPTIKACVMHPAVQAVVLCERPCTEEFIRVSYGMCFPCTVHLEANVYYIKEINRMIDKRLTEIQGVY